MNLNVFENLKTLMVSKGKIDVVLDTDAYNEIDDSFAIAYLLLSKKAEYQIKLVLFRIIVNEIPVSCTVTSREDV